MLLGPLLPWTCEFHARAHCAMSHNPSDACFLTWQDCPPFPTELGTCDLLVPASPTNLYAWFSLPIFPDELHMRVIFANVLEEFVWAFPILKIVLVHTLVLIWPVQPNQCWE